MSILVHEYSYDDEIRVAKQEGREEERTENARRMKADGIETALIGKYTGLTEAEIASL
ncbi:MAG: hypothetical protein LBC58_06805 [Clostridiales Family XIII bacterium]|nr:hypothetical protein [Clostridiales Family XIII bacterium]